MNTTTKHLITYFGMIKTMEIWDKVRPSTIINANLNAKAISSKDASELVNYCMLKNQVFRHILNTN